MKLSICVITMNRAAQLKEALESCLACDLPRDTEFVIVDNASTDDTEQTVHATLKDCGYSYLYEKLSENLGVGGGRNYAYSKVGGEYMYMMDDDAVIDTDKNPDFFVRAVEILDQESRIVTLTTQIYDTVWLKNRVDIVEPQLLPNVYKCQMFCGGSHFLRKSFYTDPPYLHNKYGYEEIPPSLRAINAGKLNVFTPDLLVIHKPVINKWNWDDEKNHELLIKGIALPYAIKKMMYPKIVSPILNLAIARRISIYLNNIDDAKVKVKTMARSFLLEFPIREKMKLSTIFQMIRDFGLATF